MKITTYLFIGFLFTLRDEGKSDFSIHTYGKQKKNKKKKKKILYLTIICRSTSSFNFRMTLHFTINLKFTNGARIRRVIGVILIMLTLYKDYLMKAFSN